MHSACVYLEIGQSSLKALKGGAGLEMSLERLPNGRLSEACKSQMSLGLQGFLKQDLWQPRLRALCAVGARGVSLRRLTLPASSKENLRKLLLLQIESEFPLPPDALAWGYRQLPMTDGPDGHPRRAQAAANGKQDYLVVAVKKEVIQEYWEVLSGCGVTPVFTLAGLARSSLQSQSFGACALLDIGRDYSEFMSFDNGVPTAVRILPWGGESITRAIEHGLGISRDEAETLKLRWARESLPDSQVSRKVQAAIEAEVDSLADVIKGHWNGQTLYLSGKSAHLKELPSELARRLGAGGHCESLEPPAGEGRSAAILGLLTAARNGRESPPLVIQLTPANGTAGPARRDVLKWAVVAGLLALALLAFPYGEALLLKSRLSRKLAAIQTDRNRLTTIDRELDFLRYLKQSQPPYLDVLYLLAKAAPQGARFDSLSMNRRGDLSLRGSMKDSQQVVGFRSKLIESGLFANVAVEEQTPTPDRQKLTVRISAQWKPAGERATLAIGPSAEEIEKAKTRPKQAPGGAFPGMGPGFPGGPPAPVGPPRGVPGTAISLPVAVKGPPPPGSTN